MAYVSESGGRRAQDIRPGEDGNASSEERKMLDDPCRMSELRLVLIGKTGTGKSASGNTILGHTHFLSALSAGSVTRVCEQASVERPGAEGRKRVTVVDMPGFGDTRLSAEEIRAEIARCVVLTAPGPHAFLLVVPLGRFTGDEARVAGEMAQIFGEGALLDHTIVLFTRGDELEGRSFEEYLGAAPEELRSLLGRCGGRYHVLNNRAIEDREQVRKLLEKVERMLEGIGGACYTCRVFREAEEAIRDEQERIMQERGEEEEEEEEATAAEAKLSKRRKCDLEDGGGEAREEGGGARWRAGPRERDQGGEWDVPGLDLVVRQRAGEERSVYLSSLGARGLAWGERWRRRRGADGAAGSRRRAIRSALGRFRREAVLSEKVLAKVKVLVAAGATGMVVGAAFGAAAPLAAAAGASVAGNALGLAAGQLAGASVAGGVGVAKVVGAIVAAAAGKTAVALGAATGGVLGGSVGALAGAEANSPGEAAVEALGQVGAIGATAVGVAAGVGGAVGVGGALGALLEGTAAGSVAIAGGGSLGGSVAAAGSQAVATGGSVPGAAVADAVASQAAVATAGGVAGALETAGATARIMTAVTEIGKAAAGIALAGGLVVKVVKEKIRSGSSDSGYTERRSYEIYWNK